MTIRGAVLLAAVGGALSVGSALFSSFLTWLSHAFYGRGFSLEALRFPLLGWLEALIFLAALPAFLLLLYKSEPLLSVPEVLKKAAWVAAVARGLAAIPVLLRLASRLLTHAEPFGDTAYRMSHPIAWALQRFHGIFVAPSISLFAALALVLFFLSVARAETGSQAVPRRVKAAAIWAAVVAAVQVVFVIMTTVTWSRLQAGSQAVNVPWLWSPILELLTRLFYQGSLAAFLIVFCRKLPTSQSNHRFSTGA